MQQLFAEMLRFYAGDPQQIQHFTKVHNFARFIGLGEELDPNTLQILEIAALVHDIGIKPALAKHGSANGKLQEQEGPPVAKEMLEKLGYSKEVIERVCFLVGHHHTYSGIDGADYQILVEADFLVNLFEGNMQPDAVLTVYQNIFRTQTGREYCKKMFGLAV